jgi:peptidoglycan/xylan/chitin deacetylase (PgdA/CDA1 family)
MLKKVNVANRVTWFIPGHSAESFPKEVQQVIDSGCEIGLHGYAHEGAYSLTVQQERDILEKCIEISTKLTGKKPVGYRAPLYQIRETTLDLLEEYGFEYGMCTLPPTGPNQFSLFLTGLNWNHQTHPSQITTVTRSLHRAAHP